MAIQKSIRWMFIATTAIFMLAGAGCVGFGGYFMSNPFSRRNAVVSEDNIVSLIAIGVIVMFSSMVGFFSFMQPVVRKPLMLAYCFTVIGIVVVLIVMGITIWFKTLTMYDDFGENWHTWDASLRLGFQSLNPSAPCCGYASPRDFPAASGFCSSSTPGTVPGCQGTVYAYADSYLRNIYTCLFVFVFIGIFDFFTGVMMVQAANEEERYERMSQKLLTKPGEMKMQYM